MNGPLETIRGVLQGTSVRWVLSDTDGLVDVLINVTQDFAQARPGNVTDRPIEDGTTITDHVRLNPQRIDLTAILTPDTSGITLATLLKTDVDERAEIIVAWRDTATILKLTGRLVIDNLVIENLTERRSADLKDSRMFDIVLRQVTIADTDAVSEAGVGTRELQTEETAL